MKIEVDVEVALGVQFVGNSRRRIIGCDVLFALVIKEAWEGLIYRAGEFRLVRFLVGGCDPLTGDVGIGDTFLSDIRRVADDDIEPLLFTRKDFDKGDVPDKRHTFRAPKPAASRFEMVEVFGQRFRSAFATPSLVDRAGDRFSLRLCHQAAFVALWDRRFVVEAFQFFRQCFWCGHQLVRGKAQFFLLELFFRPVTTGGVIIEKLQFLVFQTGDTGF